MKKITTIRYVIAVCLLSSLAAESAAYSPLFSPASEVAMSADVIVVGRLKEGTVEHLPVKSHLGEPPVEFTGFVSKATLIVTSVEHGKFTEKETTLWFPKTAAPIVGGEFTWEYGGRRRIQIRKRGREKNSIAIYEINNSAYEMNVGRDLREDHVWFLRAEGGLPGMATDAKGWCIDHAQCVQPVEDKGYYLAYLATDVKAALVKQLIGAQPHRQDEIREFLATVSKADSLETKTISLDARYYHGWPTIARRRDGTLLVVCSGGREAHICPFGRVELIVSRDDGKTWTWPRTILDGDLDDRDAGILETPKGTLVVTTFTSLAYERLINKLSPRDAAAWEAARDRLSPEDRKKQLGEWVIRSTDGGLSWSAPSRSIVNSPHGPIALKDGRLLYLGKELYAGGRIGACESTDDGATWRWLSEIPTRKGDNAAKGYHELHAVEATDGTIIAHIRNEDANPDPNETLQTESRDGGRTWSEPHTIGVWGLPSHLLLLRDGRLLMSYGHRRKPFGNQARTSADHGKSWSEPITLSDDGADVDLGYPSTVQLGDGSLLTVWYERMRDDNGKAVLRQARWKLPAIEK